MSQHPPPPLDTPPLRRLGNREFIAMAAMLFATVAFSMDAMLPALPQIAAELSPQSPNLAQLILTSFILGMGVGTLVAGPLSDSFGRRGIILVGGGIYIIGTFMAWHADTLGTMLFARFIQGLGAASPRVVTLALIRDLYKGRDMARIVSFVMMIFTLVPAVAPSIGQMIMGHFGWRSIFMAFLLFISWSIVWMMLRQPETLPRSRRPAFRPALLWQSFKEVLSYKIIRQSIFAQSLGFAVLFASLSSIQQIFDHTFDRGANFPLWFAGLALIAGSSGMCNAALLPRFGMRQLVFISFIAQAGFSALCAVSFWLNILPQPIDFIVYFIWAASQFFMAGMIMGNLNALALEPVGHIAGMAASVVGAVSTVLSLMLAIPVGQMFDGTTRPVMSATFLFCLGGAIIVKNMRREH